MARSKEFDPDVVLDAAMRLFWLRGYEATSTAELVEHLGIARASLYATFGSKHDLYLKAFDRYISQRDPELVELLSESGPALSTVRKLLEHYAATSMGEDAGRGCFVVNAAIERMGEDDEVARRVRSSWDTVEVALTLLLSRAKAQGELRADANPRAMARFLLVFLQGIRVFDRAGQCADRIRDATTQALASLG